MPMPSDAERRAPLPPALPILLSLAFLLAVPGSPLADPSDEVGGDPGAPDRAGLSLGLGRLTPELSVFAGYRVFAESDMADTYGGLPRLGVEAAVLFDERARFVVGVAYGAASGDPHYDTPEFESGQETELTAVPVTVGFRLDASENPRFGLHFGVDVVAAWMEERTPDPYSDGDLVADDGWAAGLRLSLTPEWRSADGRRALGLSFEWGGASGEVYSGYDRHEVNLIGYGARLHATWAL